MTPNRAARALIAAAASAALAFGAGACGGDAETETASADSPAPDFGQRLERVRLTEGTAYTMELSTGSTAAVRMTGHSAGDEPSVAIDVTPEGGDAATHTLGLGESLDVEGDRWRVSEIGMSGTAGQPSSVTLTRGEDGSGSPSPSAAPGAPMSEPGTASAERGAAGDTPSGA
ncbi:DUF6406 domain-containing protein [Nocardiopsis coralliicola]